MKRIGRKKGNENPSSQSHWLGFKSAGNVYNSGLQTEHSWHIWGSSALPFKKLKWRNTTNVNLGLKGPPFRYGSVINREKKWFLLFFQRKLFQSKHTCCFTDIYFKRLFLAFPSRYGWLLLRWTSPPWQRVLCTKPFPSHRRSTHSSWAEPHGPLQPGAGPAPPAARRPSTAQPVPRAEAALTHVVAVGRLGGAVLQAGQDLALAHVAVAHQQELQQEVVGSPRAARLAHPPRRLSSRGPSRGPGRWRHGGGQRCGRAAACPALAGSAAVPSRRRRCVRRPCQRRGTSAARVMNGGARLSQQTAPASCRGSRRRRGGSAGRQSRPARPPVPTSPPPHADPQPAAAAHWQDAGPRPPAALLGRSCQAAPLQHSLVRGNHSPAHLGSHCGAARLERPLLVFPAGDSGSVATGLQANHWLVRPSC